MYGILSETDGKLVMHNKVFETLLYEYLIAQMDIQEMASKFTQVDKSEVLDNNKLDMEKLLLKFQELCTFEKSTKCNQELIECNHEHFYETNGRLIFLAYLKPILNGIGFSFVEPQTRQNKRMDIVITYGGEKHIVELKICPDKKSAERNQDHFTSLKGIEQLTQYMKEQKVNTGYLLTFNFNKNKQYTGEWIEINGKRIFEVMV
jgi:hypothetical protein